VLAGWLSAAGSRAATGRAEDVDRRLEGAVASAGRFLLGKLGPKGHCLEEADEKSPQFGGKTALCVHALLTAGLKPQKTPALSRAIAWLRKAKLTGTYAVATRACAFARLRDPESRAVLRADARWLTEAMNAEGGYTYTSSGGAANATYDNSNAQMALLGVWAAARRGVDVPPAYWSRAERYWLEQQQPDGGWGYRTHPRTLQAKTYGSMTAAGLASLFICFDNLRAEKFVRCAASAENEPIAKALAWMGKSFLAHENPRKGVEWYYYWLYCAARVGLASGHKYFGAHDWYAEGRRELLACQNGDGSWGYGERIVETAFALMFIVRGRHPVLVNKLRYAGKWNARPRDAANFARWLSYTFERPVSWQIVNMDSSVADWHEAPILYLSGAGPIELTGEQIDRLRLYARQGGLILSEAACSNGDFTLDMGKLYRKLFPEYPLERLAADHPVYAAHFPPQTEAWLSGVSNGLRLLAVHAPREVSLALQLGYRPAGRPIYELLANVYMYATDRGMLRPRGSAYWPAEAKVTPRATIRLARLRHAGNCDPEPLAWRRLAILVANRHGVKLDVSAPISPAELDPARWPVAHLTGTRAFTLAAAETKALAAYLSAGGTLVADAAGGSRTFADAVKRQIYPLVPDGRRGELTQDHAIYLGGPHKLDRVRYRREYAATLGSEKTRPHLRVVLSGERPAIIFSREDITSGLLGTPAYRMLGYAPDSAERLMTNILFHAAGLSAAPTTRPGAGQRGRR